MAKQLFSITFSFKILLHNDLFFVRIFSVLRNGKIARIQLNSDLKVILMKSIVQKLLKGLQILNGCQFVTGHGII